MAYIKQKSIASLFVILLVFAGYSLPVLASDITPDRVVELVNGSRVNGGLRALRVDDRLTLAAQMKLDDMFEKGYFSHTSPDGTTPWVWVEKSGYDYTHAGENLAIHFVSAEKEHEAWMKSPTHRRNILSDEYADIGVAVGQGTLEGVKTTVAVQFFGMEASHAAADAGADSSLAVSMPFAEPQVSGLNISTNLQSRPVYTAKSLASPDWIDEVRTVSVVVLAAVLAVSFVMLAVSLVRMVQIGSVLYQRKHAS